MRAALEAREEHLGGGGSSPPCRLGPWATRTRATRMASATSGSSRTRSNRLRALRDPGENYSVVILRLAGRAALRSKLGRVIRR